MINEFIIDAHYKRLICNRLPTSIHDLVSYFLNRNHLIEKIAGIIDGPLKSTLGDYSNVHSPVKALLIKGLPIDQCMPKTPSLSSDLVTGQTPITQLMLLSLATNLGKPIGFSSENNGAIIHNICPMKDKAHTKSGQGSHEPLSMHSDFAFSDHRPDWLILMCLRNNQNIPTRICFVSDICSQLSYEEIAILMNANFLIYPPDSSEIKTPRVDAILSRRGKTLVSRFNQDKCKGQCDKSEAVLEKFADIATKQGREVLLAAGDALIFDNKAALHSRQSFEPKYDGTDRWLQRVYCKAENEAKTTEIEIIRDLAEYGAI